MFWPRWVERRYFSPKANLSSFMCVTSTAVFWIISPFSPLFPFSIIQVDFEILLHCEAKATILYNSFYFLCTWSFLIQWYSMKLSRWTQKIIKDFTCLSNLETPVSHLLQGPKMHFASFSYFWAYLFLSIAWLFPQIYASACILPTLRSSMGLGWEWV